MSEGEQNQYTAILKSIVNQKVYSLYCFKEDTVADIAHFLNKLKSIPDVISDEQFIFKQSEQSAPIPHHQTVEDIAGGRPRQFQLVVEIQQKNGKNKPCCVIF